MASNISRIPRPFSEILNMETTPEQWRSLIVVPIWKFQIGTIQFPYWRRGLFRHGKQSNGLARRRTPVHRTSRPADRTRHGGKESFPGGNQSSGSACQCTSCHQPDNTHLLHPTDSLSPLSRTHARRPSGRFPKRSCQSISTVLSQGAWEPPVLPEDHRYATVPHPSMQRNLIHSQE